MKTYENFIKDLLVNSPELKLTKYLVKFLNSIDLKCNYLKDDKGILWIYDEEKQLSTTTNYKLMMKMSYIRIYQSGKFKLHTTLLFTPDDITNFLQNIFQSDIISFDVNFEDIPKISKQLTKKNFELYITTKKYNL